MCVTPFAASPRAVGHWLTAIVNVIPQCGSRAVGWSLAPATGHYLLRERQQGDVARLLDRIGQAALVRRAYAGQTPRNDLARLGHKLPEAAARPCSSRCRSSRRRTCKPSCGGRTSVRLRAVHQDHRRDAPRDADHVDHDRRRHRRLRGRELGAELLLLPSLAATGAAVLVVSSAMFLLRASTKALNLDCHPERNEIASAIERSRRTPFPHNALARELWYLRAGRSRLCRRLPLPQAQPLLPRPLLLPQLLPACPCRAPWCRESP